MTKTSSLSHKGTLPVGLRLQTEWNSIFFFFRWRVMSKSGNGFYISSVISRASRWASWVFILQTPNLDLSAHVDEGAGVRRCRKCEGIRMNSPPPPSSQTSICELMKKSVHESRPMSVQTGSAWILRWNGKCPFMFTRYERLYRECYINYHMMDDILSPIQPMEKWLLLFFLIMGKKISLLSVSTLPANVHHSPAHWNSPMLFFLPFLYSKISRSGFYRIVSFNEGLEKLIFPSVAPLIAIHLIKLHGIFNLASWASILT